MSVRFRQGNLLLTVWMQLGMFLDGELPAPRSSRLPGVLLKSGGPSAVCENLNFGASAHYQVLKVSVNAAEVLGKVSFRDHGCGNGQRFASRRNGVALMCGNAHVRLVS